MMMKTKMIQKTCDRYWGVIETKLDYGCKIGKLMESASGQIVFANSNSETW
jgi:hypothetical protein